MYGTFSRTLSRLPGIQALLGKPIVWLRPGTRRVPAGVTEIAGWGLRPSTVRPRQWAARHDLPFVTLEDGFLRSLRHGKQHPSLSLVVDEDGIYYAASAPSTLEKLLASDVDLLAGPGADAKHARELVQRAKLSKYNLAPDLDPSRLSRGRPRILVVDQTRGDAGITHGLADEATFRLMLARARQENPDATLYIKTHPEVSDKVKRGYFSNSDADARTVLLRDPINPMSLVAHMDRVYVVTSHLGFEALLAGTPVSCFGMPWYAGWGATQDEQHSNQRQRHRSIDELFAAAYLHYTRYLNPVSGSRGTIFDVIEWLQVQRAHAARNTGRSIAIGYRRWKAENVRPFLHSDPKSTYFVPHAEAAAQLQPSKSDRLIIWGANVKPEVEALATKTGATLLRMEDGFVRSVGLGSDFVPPGSLVLDRRGIYFDPRTQSDLEYLLNTRTFDAKDLRQARIVQDLIVEHGITKYNIERREAPAWAVSKQRVVLVPGQVEDDASVVHGCESVRTNLGLLAQVRVACPDAFIVYKPHPDVAVKNRNGKVHGADALRYANAIETTVSIISCIEACDEVHTMTSLTGFDALLRNKRVTVYGRPFYAGWGLTVDMLSIPRRDRKLTLHELVAGALVHYPIYWDWNLQGYTTCEALIRQLVKRRDALSAEPGGASLHMNFSRRQLHKIRLWARAGFFLKR
ncbi:capsular polysaccharide biosynthesis protein [Achromobacter insolitus]|uniref:capsular polysaccharide biosynthesis protein n=1 Tax=Achromobacter insolitus TaxID=217204 RepID=UPI0027E10A6B|nr:MULTISPECIES: capsular polysaccharide biosynthesis protein [Achromobacter]MDQ6212200.1 capsular polysaccharide biosynthesis protein [Achromobacter insolitus]MEB3097108.1 capsular polysaccharide biosynthesis protein [Achromobacter sp. D10]